MISCHRMMLLVLPKIVPSLSPILTLVDMIIGMGVVASAGKRELPRCLFSSIETY